MGGYRISAIGWNRRTCPSHSGAPGGADLEWRMRRRTPPRWREFSVDRPANGLGPEELAEAAMDLARDRGARCQVLSGGELASYPMLRAVGGASARRPRLIDLRWGERAAPRVTLVGKGVCFDTGGLDLKPSAGMLLMKKDMGGAACALGLADMVMRLEIPCTFGC